MIRPRIADNFADGRRVGFLRCPAQGEDKELFGQRADEPLRPLEQRLLESGNAFKLLPSGSPPAASIGLPSSSDRQRPTASNCSSAKPTGSIRRWQLAQLALERCSANRSRMERVAATVVSFKEGTLAGGGGGGVPSMFSRIHLPRTTGEVRVA